MAPNILLESFRVTGTTLKEFKKAANDFDDATTLLPLNFTDAYVYSFLMANKGSVKYNVFSSGSNFNISNSGAIVVGKTANVKMDYIQQFYPYFFDEITHENKTVFRLHVGEEEKFFFFGETFFKTFSAQTSCIGGSFLKEHSIERDIALARIFEQELKLNALVRTTGKISKIFGVFSDKFYRVPLANIAKCVDYFKEAEVKFWEINQKETQIYMEFPQLVSEYENPVIVPGIRIVTSDTGYSQTDIDLCFRNMNGKAENYHRVKKISYKHNKEISVEEIIAEIETALNEQRILVDRFLKYRESLTKVPVKGVNAYKRTINELLSIGEFKGKMGVKTQKIVIEFLTRNTRNEVEKAQILDRIIGLSDTNNGITDYQKEKFREVLGNIIKNVA